MECIISTLINNVKLALKMYQSIIRSFSLYEIYQKFSPLTVCESSCFTSLPILSIDKSFLFLPIFLHLLVILIYISLFTKWVEWLLRIFDITFACGHMLDISIVYFWISFRSIVESYKTNSNFIPTYGKKEKDVFGGYWAVYRL